MGHKKTEKKKKKSSAQLYKGTLEVTRSGMGFVIAKALDRDILVRPNDFNTAMHGDTVLVNITQSKGGSGRVQGMPWNRWLKENKPIFPDILKWEKALLFLLRKLPGRCRMCIFR